MLTKTKLAAAALLVIAGSAQAEVKVYGMLDLSVGSFDTAHAKNASTRASKVESGNMQTSFIGFSADENLGGGLKAEIAIESFLQPDTGAVIPVTNKAGGFWGRGSFVALSGDFGKVALGQYDNPLFTSGYTYNPFGSSFSFSPTMRHFYYGAGAIAQSAAGTGFDTGFVNSITYETPTMSGFSGTLQLSPKESTAAGKGNSYAASGSYNIGAFSGSLTYVKSGIALAYDADEKVMGLGASYDFGVVKAFGQYTTVKQTSAIKNDDVIYQVGVSVPTSAAGAVLASFGKDTNKLTVGGKQESDTVLSIGYDHKLSKRTDIYAVFSNNSHTKLEAGRTFAAGIRHNF